jgi:23S rRNA-/tRNA-specific pseudouridylate synthase
VTIFHEKGNEDTFDFSEGKMLTTPKTGWYALCFTRVETPDSSRDNRNNDDSGSDEERNQRREAKAGFSNQKELPSTSGDSHTPGTAPSGLADCYFSLCIQLPAKDENEEDPQRMKKIKLDVLHDDTTKDLANEIGKLYYLPENSKAVVLVGSKNKAADETDSRSLGISIQETNLRWFLLYRSSTAQEVGCEVTAVPNPGDALACKKCIMCATCQKRFPKAAAALDHWSKRHKPKEIKEEEAKGRYHNCSQYLPKSLTVVFQDDHMAVVDKPQGVAVMGDKNSLLRSDLLLALAVPVEETQKKDDNSTSPTFMRKPVPVHRLDAGTGGLLVIAKTVEADRDLKMSFANRETHKRYRALLLGRLEPKEGTIDHPVSGQPSKSRYVVLNHHPCSYSKDGWLTAVDLFPVTGRRHQLRKHMKWLGHPIIGDRRYYGYVAIDDNPEKTPTEETEGNEQAADDTSVMSRLCLWAVGLTLPHPWTKEEVTFELPDPEWFLYVVKQSAPEIM